MLGKEDGAIGSTVFAPYVVEPRTDTQTDTQSMPNRFSCLANPTVYPEARRVLLLCQLLEFLFLRTEPAFERREASPCTAVSCLLFLRVLHVHVNDL